MAREEKTPLLSFALSVVGVFSFFSLYGAPSLRDELLKSEALAGQPWLMSSATALMKASDSIGFGALRGGLDKARKKINAPYTVLTKPPPPPVAPPVVPPSSPPVANGHQGPKHHGPIEKRRILVIGASSIQFAIGVEFETRVPTYPGVQVKRFGQLATGLARPDFFNWPKKLEELASQFRPDLVIANYGGNDAQDIPLPNYKKAAFKTPAWEKAFTERVQEMINIGKKHNADFVMLGMPIMRSKAFSAKMKRLNRVMKSATESAGGLFIPTWKMAATPSGKYRKTITYRGKRGLMRTSDGVHYSRLGARFVVEQVLQEIERHYALRSPKANRATAQRHGFDSKVTQERFSYLAYVPQGAKKLPALYLLRGRQSGWDAWPGHPHRTLQALATKHQRVLILPERADWWVGAPAKAFLQELLDDAAHHLPITDSISIAGFGSGAHGAVSLSLLSGRFESLSAEAKQILGEVPPSLKASMGEAAQAWKDASPELWLEKDAPKTRIKLSGAQALHERMTAQKWVHEHGPMPESKPRRRLDELLGWHAGPNK